MLDRDLAILYGVTTGALNQQVQRNHERFPDDFSFRLTAEEAAALISQVVISKRGRGGRRLTSRFLPHAFTEQGVAMLSSVLRSDRAVQANIAIMRAFVELRKTLAASPGLAERLRQAELRLSAHEATLGEHGQAIREVFADIRALMEPATPRKAGRRRARRAKPKLIQMVTTIRS